LNDRSLLRQKTAKHVGKNAPHRGAVRGGDDTYPGPAPTAQNASELRQAETGSGKNCNPSWPHHRIKGGIRERQRLPVRSYRQKAGSFSRPPAASSIAGAMSAPIRRPDEPMSGIMATAASPVPVDASSTRSPRLTSAEPTSSGTKSLDHRPVNWSYAVVSVARPGLT
jgi:hypothetical protein